MTREKKGAISTSNHAVSRSAFKVMVGGVLSLFAGLGAQIVVASLFGAGAEMDAYLTALVVPTYIQAVLLAGLPFVFIPAFVQTETTGDDEEAWALAGTVFWLVTGTLLVVAVGGSLLAEEIIALSAPGLSPEKAELSASMLAVLMFAVPFTGLGSLTRGIQNARNRFFWPASGVALGQMGNLLVMLFLYRSMGPMALAWGFVVSQGLRASVTLIPVLRHGWARLLSLKDERLREMGRLMAPFVFFGILVRSSSILERYFASDLPDGDLSYLGYAAKITKIVTTLLATGVVTAFLPALARAYAQKGEAGLVEKLEYGLRLTLAVGLPALAILSALAAPLIMVLFERGAFDHATTLSVSRILPIVMLGAVVFDMAGNLVSRSFYVLKDTRTVSFVGAWTSILYIFLAKGLVSIGGYVGLAAAKPLYIGLSILVLLGLLLRRLSFFPTGRLFKGALAYGGASLVAFVIALLIRNALAFLPALVQLVAAFAVAAPLYMVILFRMDRDIAISILEMTGVERLLKGAKVGRSVLAKRFRGDELDARVP
ncbi:murein biosynthesis integral membrane protein MurJ [Chloroflexota bacterium]